VQNRSGGKGKEVRKTKIIATLSGGIGYETLQRMAKIFDCVRINFSHGNLQEYQKIVQNIRKIEKDQKKYIPILFDISGPKIRVSDLRDDIQIARGEYMLLCRDYVKDFSGKQIKLNYPRIVRYVKKDQRVYIDDGKIRFKVVENVKGGCLLEAQAGGVIKKNKGVNFPDTNLPLPSLTAKDLKDIEHVSALGGDFVALSFVREKEDILSLRRLLSKKGLNIPIIAKIERPEVIKNLDDVIAVSDGIMVARGDLGVELSLEKVPIYQKKIIEMCRENGKPVIVATQILETMVEKPEPTRAEVSDIANAIFDGCDTLMLSGETAFGKYPVEALSMLDKVSRETERHLKNPVAMSPKDYKFLKGDTTSAIAFSAFSAAQSLNAKAIVCFTTTGQTAVVLSKFRPEKPVIAASYDEKTLKKVNLYFGVKPLCVKKKASADALMYDIETALLNSGFKKGDLVIMTIGLPVAEKGNTNIMKVHVLGGYLPYKEQHLRKKNENV
jgi:pyruvate kinase